MTTTNEILKSGPYNGDGVTTVFSVTFDFFAETEIDVILTSATGADTTKTISTHYTVTGGGGGTGSITMTTPPAADEKVTIISNIPYTQTLNFQANEPTGAEDQETALDRLVVMVRQLAELAGRSVTISPSSSVTALNLPSPEDGKALLWDGTGGDIKNSADLFDDIVTDAEAAQTAAELAKTQAEALVSGITLGNPIQFATNLDMQTYDIITTGGADMDLHSDGNVNMELGDNAGVKKLSILDSDSAEVASIDSNGDATLTSVNGLKHPVADGTAGQVIKTDGAGQLSFTTTARSVVQVVHAQDGTVATGTTTIPDDDTIPQNTEGDEYLTATITPTDSANKLKIDVVVHLANTNASTVLCAALFQDSTASALAAGSSVGPAANVRQQVVFTHYMTAGTTSATTFKVRCGGSASGTTTFNGVTGGARLGGIIASNIIITELLT